MTEPESARPRLITADKLHAALVAAGVIRDGESIRRIVIDAQAGHVVVIHVERWGDTRLLDVVHGLDGVEIRESPVPVLEVNDAGYPTGGLVQVVNTTPKVVPYPVDAEHPPADFDG